MTQAKEKTNSTVCTTVSTEATATETETLQKSRYINDRDMRANIVDGKKKTYTTIKQHLGSNSLNLVLLYSCTLGTLHIS